ncbi:MAG: addiction module protein [Planctomycetaceae bacterium]|nr:addiction module protein [Planctomycetaceae bacterium]
MEILDAAQRLSRDERIVLVQALWDSIAETESPVLDDALKAELDRRITEDDANPGTGLAWDDVKRQILSRP